MQEKLPDSFAWIGLYKSFERAGFKIVDTSSKYRPMVRCLSGKTGEAARQNDVVRRGVLNLERNLIFYSIFETNLFFTLNLLISMVLIIVKWFVKYDQVADFKRQWLAMNPSDPDSFFREFCCDADRQRDASRFDHFPESYQYKTRIVAGFWESVSAFDKAMEQYIPDVTTDADGFRNIKLFDFEYRMRERTVLEIDIARGGNLTIPIPDLTNNPEFRIETDKEKLSLTGYIGENPISTFYFHLDKKGRHWLAHTEMKESFSLLGFGSQIMAEAVKQFGKVYCSKLEEIDHGLDGTHEGGNHNHIYLTSSMSEFAWKCVQKGILKKEWYVDPLGELKGSV